MKFTEIPCEQLRVGDIADCLGGPKRITGIRPYTGPLTGIVFAIAEVAPLSGDFSLEIGGYVRVAR